jgi:hypothetical protein
MSHSHGQNCHGESHDHDHEHDHSDDITPALQQSLYSYIKFDSIVTLNESVTGSGKAVVKKEWTQRLEVEPQIESDTDEQLLMTVPYVCPHSIFVHSPRSCHGGLNSEESIVSLVFLSSLTSAIASPAKSSSIPFSSAQASHPAPRAP